MSSYKQIIWMVIALAVGGIIAWFSSPPIRRTHPAIVLALCAVAAVVVLFTGCRRPRIEKLKDRYFVRCFTYDVMTNGHILITDNKSPKVITLDPWLEVVFAAADGQRTVQEFIEQLKTEYPDGAPAGLTEQTYKFLAKMEAEGLIRFTDQKTQLPYYLSMPTSQQDKERALAEMKKDGFIK